MISIDNIYNKIEIGNDNLTIDEEIFIVRTFLNSSRITNADKHKRLKDGFDGVDLLDMVNRIIAVRR